MSKNDRQKQGYVYILINQSYPGLLKIGMTTRTPEERAKELSRPTGVATPFFVAYQQEVSNCELVEQEIHAHLSNFRHRNNREFFEMPLHEAVKTIPKIIENVERRLTIESAMSILDSNYCHEDQKYFIENFVLSASQYISDANLTHRLLIKLVKLYNKHLIALMWHRYFFVENIIHKVEDEANFFLLPSQEHYIIYPSDIEFPSMGVKVDEPIYLTLETIYPDDLCSLSYDYENNTELCLITKGMASLIADIDERNYNYGIVSMAIEEISEKGNKLNMIELFEHIVDFFHNLTPRKLIHQEDKKWLVFYQNPAIESTLSAVIQNEEDLEIIYLVLFCQYILYLLGWSYFQDEGSKKQFLDFIEWNGSAEKTKAIARYSTSFFYILSQFDKQSIDEIFRITYLEKYERGADVDDKSLVNILNEMSHVNEYAGEEDEEIGFSWCQDNGTKEMIIDSLIKLRSHFDEETLTIYLKSLL